MNERKYSIREGLLQASISAFKSLSMLYHATARGIWWGSKRLRRMGDQMDQHAEEVKREMRKQDGQE